MIITRVSNLVTVCPKSGRICKSLCPPGTDVSGGGYFASARVTLPIPYDLDGWQAAVFNDGPTDVNLRTFAVCMGLSS